MSDSAAPAEFFVPTAPRAITLAAAYVIAVTAGLVCSGDSLWGLAVLAGAILLAIGLVVRALWISRAGGAPAILRTVLMFGIGYLVLVVIGSIGGCSSSELPQDLTDAQRKLVVDSHFPVTVGVASSKSAGGLVAELRATGLFDRVELLDDLAVPPALVATVDGSGFGAAIIPFQSIVTAGIVPTRYDDAAGLEFRLARPGDGQNGVSVWYLHRSVSYLGWASGLLNCLPSRTSGEVRSHPRYHAAFAAHIAGSADAIRALIPN